jgi:hypothetical protein
VRAGSKPAITLSIVVLPHPDGPNTQVSDPDGAISVASLRTSWDP